MESIGRVHIDYRSFSVNTMVQIDNSLTAPPRVRKIGPSTIVRQRLRVRAERNILEEAEEPSCGEIVTHNKVASLQVQSVAKQALLIVKLSDAQVLPAAEDSLHSQPISDEV